MKVLVNNISEKRKGTIVIPVLKTDTLNRTLENIAKEFNIPSDRLQSDLKGDLKDVASFYFESTKVYVLGLGEKPATADIVSAFRSVSFQNKTKFGESITLDFINSNVSDLASIEAAVNGFALGIYRIGLYKSEPNGIHPLSKNEAVLNISVKNDVDSALKAAEKGIATAETQIRIMDLVNASPNNKTPQVLADWAVASGKEFDFRVTIFNKKDCETHGLHGLLSVNKGSENEPRFIIMEYKGQAKNSEKLPKVGLVGKGVTFDTGGISIKPSSNMHLMKSDMGGAAAVLGTMELAAKLKLPIHLIGIIPSTENMVDGAGTKPGDVINTYLGKSIEVIDTDAEGRLILADGLAYMKKNFEPDHMIDLATLTGSVIMTLGYNAAGLFSNDDKLAEALLKAGDSTGERLWRLPLWEVYFEDIKSDVADIANLGNKPMSGAITAAKFLEFFTDKHLSWAHLDIAGVAMANNELGQSRLATAYGIRLLINFLENI